jgi:hypothetical protein
MMNFPSKTFAALLVTASVPLFAGSVTAAPTGQSLALSNVEISQAEQVQWRRGRRGGRWVGPAIGFGAGVAVGGALAGSHYYYGDGYSAYGAAPGYGYAPRSSYGWGGDPCIGDSDYNSAYPSWQCRTYPRATDRYRW